MVARRTTEYRFVEPPDGVAARACRWVRSPTSVEAVPGPPSGHGPGPGTGKVGCLLPAPPQASQQEEQQACRRPRGGPVDREQDAVTEDLAAAEIAREAEFFSFGTNDLTQTTFGISRDDSAHFLEHYLAQGVIDVDPFVSLDQDGVGELVTIAAERGRSARPDLKLGICGEHGGDPASIAFCHRAGLDYVSCSPYRVPIARLAAAQAAIGTAGPDGD